jgi:hypothetical protein
VSRVGHKFGADVGLQQLAYHIAQGCPDDVVTRRQFSKGMKNLLPHARATVYASVDSMVDAMERRRPDLSRSIARINDVIYTSTSMRFMPLVAGEMRARNTIRKLASLSV